MKYLYTARLKALVADTGVANVTLAEMAGISRRRIDDALLPSTTAINLSLDTLVRVAVALSALLDREPEDVFYDLIDENLVQLDALWEQSDKKPSRQVVLRKLGGA